MRAALRNPQLWLSIIGTAFTAVFLAGGAYVALGKDIEALVALKNLEHMQIKETIKSDKNEVARTLDEIKADLRDMRKDIRELVRGK